MEEVKTNKKAEPTLVNVSTIGNEYTKEQLQQYNREKKQIIFKRRRLTVIFTIATIFFVLSGFNLISGYRHIGQLEKEKVAALREKEELEKNEKSLRYSVDLLKDEDYLQKVARQKFFYTKDGELVYSLPQSGSGAVDDAKSKKDKKETSEETEKEDTKTESNTDGE
ncbi:hypothetical protein G7081_02550 [Vagococcus coleopterorum]|uniref:Cell division protein DivIC n=1 Tax=Vagococcus coleopterorum TaxID=2714946 RepID=A0A6G8AM24_9ENTE|nr:septum formation initiator family protein [Vagococcus coleopterorum]QIL46047.1 hypothetical protein G7081_02550 [Vagococcus coleopterorum]